MPCDFMVRMPFWTGLAHFALISCVQFFLPGACIYFVILAHRSNVGDFLLITGLFIGFLAVFN